MGKGTLGNVVFQVLWENKRFDKDTWLGSMKIEVYWKSMTVG